MSKYPVCRSSLSLALVVLFGSLEGVAQVPIQAKPDPDETPAVEPEQPHLEPEAPRAPEPAPASAARVRWSEPAELPEDEPEAAPKSARKLKPSMLYLALTQERFTGDDFDDSRVLVSPMHVLLSRSG